MPKNGGRKPPLRQYQCRNEECEQYERTWIQRAQEDTVSLCRVCGARAVLVEAGQEIGVYVWEFVCECGNTYTVKCRRIDTAACYGCGRDNEPGRIMPRGYIVAKTDKKHSCSRCNGRGNCPNLN